MQQTINDFLGLSSLLTGFNTVQLLGTGVAAQYLAALAQALPEGVLDELLNSYVQLPTGEGRDAAVTAKILENPKLGPVAKNLILMWYCGEWTSLPDAWHEAYGEGTHDRTGFISAEAYQAALQWVVAGAHAPGSSEQGFGSWSLPPHRSIA